MSDLHVDPERREEHEDRSGIYVRAIDTDGRWGSFDMAQLDRASFITFVSRDERWMLSILLGLFGYPRSEMPGDPS